MVDKVCFMKNGKVIECGNLNEILNRSKEFSDYYALQSKNYKQMINI